MRSVDLTLYRREVDKLLIEHKSALDSLDRDSKYLELVKEELGNVVEAQEVVQVVAQEVQNRVHRKISSVVDVCLGAVFDDPYEFKIRFDKKRDKTEACIVLSRNGIEFEDCLNEVGGGVINVISFALRVACIVLSREGLRRFLILDEPFSMIRGYNNKARTRAMLEKLASDLGFQIVLTTDIKEYQLGSVIDLEECCEKKGD